MFSIRPSKAVSVLIMIVAALLGILGLVSIPTGVGLFKLIWAIITFGIAILHGANVFSKNGISFGEINRKPRRKLK
ncbi:hypothetical protein L3i20_v208220 [Paenibacillus sp. L3-i20]|nr:hypothetical protein L3i20_v208220 [Paenibacillus sp. L3-i20]